MACRSASKFSTSWYYNFGCPYPAIRKVPNIRSQTYWYCISSQYIQKNVGDVVIKKKIFCLQIKKKVFYELIVSLGVCVFLRNKWWSWFFHVDKHERFLQIGVMIFDGNGQAFLKFPKKQVNVFTISQKRNKDKFNFFFFLQTDKH